MTKVVHVVGSLARDQGGPSYSVPALARAVSSHGMSVVIRSIGDTEDTIADMSEGVGSSVYQRDPGPMGRFLRASHGLRSAIGSDILAESVVHTHGLWLLPNTYAAQARRKLGTAAMLVHSPRGMLGREALAISAWKKRPVWWLMQRRALEATDCLHATAESEYDEIRAAGLRNPVTVIPNGIDVLDLDAFPRTAGETRTLLYIGRIHPKKGLDTLVRAWAEIEPHFPAWRLRIIGPPEAGHDKELQTLAQGLETQRLSIEAPVYGEGKLRAYREADLFCLPSLNENFAMSVAEALIAELPVISSKGAPWRQMADEGCGWWIEHGVQPLKESLNLAMALQRAELNRMGMKGRRWMERSFAWPRIGQKMTDVYRWLKTGGEPPSTVRLK